MMTAERLEARAASLAALIEKKLRVKGDGLEAKLRRGRRRMPAKVRREAERLVEAQRFADHPKLRMQVDAGALEASYARCARWLKGVDLKKRRREAALNLLTVNAFNLLAVGSGFVAYLVWAGHL
ncbi:hypothetical protein P1J78_13495 [Psychromarinibacter sp. C21-152]|uniref:Uncharacterized protein n=1 Tax=Psychromarinibacter sediminicola TaxID=3033385 RepID=A0AAE3NU77_9RHOB|nr:hypothetical protein [Psychromarinibacter sediminicola]MDF0601754.1 hypothetical protein [Psychromarinibacter sediminicola]